jgi:hypothetical protein
MRISFGVVSGSEGFLYGGGQSSGFFTLSTIPAGSLRKFER